MRYPIRALEDVLGTRHEWRGGQPAPDVALAERVGVTRSIVCQSRIRGINAIMADEWAVAAGLHPSSVWESWITDAPDDACEWCGRTSEDRKNRNHCGLETPCHIFDARRAECWWERLSGYKKNLSLPVEILSPLLLHTAETNQLSEVS